jgi:hypothetical protein
VKSADASTPKRDNVVDVMLDASHFAAKPGKPISLSDSKSLELIERTIGDRGTPSGCVHLLLLLPGISDTRPPLGICPVLCGLYPGSIALPPLSVIAGMR